MKETLKVLGKRIAYLRIKKGLTQEKLAELVHYSANHISKIESARTKPSFELLYEISKSLGVELKDLFNFDEYKDVNYIHKEFSNLISNASPDNLKILYKILKSLEI